MSTDGTDQGAPLAVESEQRVALIALADRREEIAAILVDAGLTLDAFDTVDAALAGDGPSPAAIVLWLEDAVASLPGLVESLTRRFESTPVVVACPSIERWEVRAALSAGAAGVIVEEDLASGLGSCLQAVRAGQVCVPRGHWRQVQPPALSAREKQVLGLVVGGYMNSQIAERLFLAESTVKSHLSSAFSKLGVRSRNEAADLILDPERGAGLGILGLGESLGVDPAVLG